MPPAEEKNNSKQVLTKDQKLQLTNSQKPLKIKYKFESKLKIKNKLM